MNPRYTGKIEILQGISGSGKSTYATKKEQEGWKVVSRDKIRKELVSNLDDYFRNGMDYNLENYVTEIEHKLFANFLSKNYNIIIDNTNLKKKYVQEYINIIADFINCFEDFSISIKQFPIKLDEALKRIQTRQGFDVYENQKQTIEKQYSSFVSLNWKLDDFIAEYYQIKNHDINNLELIKILKTNRQKRKWYFSHFVIDENVVQNSDEMFITMKEKAIICDLDGRLAHRKILRDGNGGCRLRSFYNAEECDTDYVDDIVLSLIENEHKNDVKVIFVSGRHEQYREKTEKFIKKCLDGINYTLYMRKDEDNRPDDIVKYEIFRDKLSKDFFIKYVLDDRKRVCAMWEELGIKVLNCGSLNDDF